MSLVVAMLGLLSLSGRAQSIIRAGNARFTVIAPECIRMEYSATGKFVDAPSYFAVNRAVSTKEYKKKLDNGGAIIGTKRMTLRYTPNGKPFSPANLTVEVRTPKGVIQWTPGMTNKQNLGGTIRTLDQVKERVPLGDGLLSRDGWYVLDDSRSPLLTKDWIEARPDRESCDWYFFAYGSNFKTALKVFTSIGGEIPLPRKYQLGSWYSRYWPYSSSDYRNIVAEYRKNDFPIDVLVLDMDWHKNGWTGWSWNRKLLPDAEQLLAWLHEQKLFVTLNLHPANGVLPYEDAYRTFMEDMGTNLDGIPDSLLPVLPYDVGSQKYMTTLFRDVHAPLEKSGVDFWWLDWQQYPYTRSIPTLENLPWLNELYFRNSEKNALRGASFSRWGGWGDHRHPIHFSGDADIHFPMLEFEIPFTSTAGNVGCFYWSHDIGGHQDMSGKNPRDNEAYTRWTQFGAMSATLRIHSTRNKDMDRRPWLCPKEYTDALRIAFHLRAELFPYIYSSAAQSHEQSVPLIRPMYIDYPGEDQSYKNPQQYMFGDHLLVAPIVTAGSGPHKVAPQKVWFPEGQWYQWLTGERYKGGGGTETVWADLNEFPLFARGGVPIALQAYTGRMTTAQLDTLIIRCYPGPDGKTGKSTLYEDDGVSQEYRNGESAHTVVTYTRHGDVVSVTIEPAKGSYSGQLTQRSYIIEFPCTKQASPMSVNGKKVAVEYNSADAVNKIALPPISVRKKIEITGRMPEAEPGPCRAAAWKRRFAGISPTQNMSGSAVLQGLSGDRDLTDEQQRLLSFVSGVTLLGSQKDQGVIAINRECMKIERLTVRVVEENGRASRTVSEQNLTATPGSAYEIDAGPRDALPLGSENIRSIVVSFAIDGKEYAWRRELQREKTFLRAWNVIGPFFYDETKAIALQKAIGENDSIISGKALAADIHGSPAFWKSVPVNDDGAVDLNEIFGSRHCMVYAALRLESEREQGVRFGIGSDDGVEMWINGKKIHSNDIKRSYAAESDTVEAVLPKGISTVLMKITQGDGGWEFGVSVKCEYPLWESFLYQEGERK